MIQSQDRDGQADPEAEGSPRASSEACPGPIRAKWDGSNNYVAEESATDELSDSAESDQLEEDKEPADPLTRYIMCTQSEELVKMGHSSADADKLTGIKLSKRRRSAAPNASASPWLELLQNVIIERKTPPSASSVISAEVELDDPVMERFMVKDKREELLAGLCLEFPATPYQWPLSEAEPEGDIDLPAEFCHANVLLPDMRFIGLSEQLMEAGFGVLESIVRRSGKYRKYGGAFSLSNCIGLVSSPLVFLIAT